MLESPSLLIHPRSVIIPSKTSESSEEANPGLVEVLGGETWTDPQGGYPIGSRLIDGGSGPKSVGGSSWMNSELSEKGKDTVLLDWFSPPESKTLILVWWDYAWKRISSVDGVYSC
jgi:hypothetical protein